MLLLPRLQPRAVRLHGHQPVLDQRYPQVVQLSSVDSAESTTQGASKKGYSCGVRTRTGVSLERVAVQILLQLSLPPGSAHPLQHAVRVIPELQIWVAFAPDQRPETHLLGRHNDELSAIPGQVKRYKYRSK